MRNQRNVTLSLARVVGMLAILPVTNAADSATDSAVEALESALSELRPLSSDGIENASREDAVALLDGLLDGSLRFERFLDLYDEAKERGLVAESDSEEDSDTPALPFRPDAGDPFSEAVSSAIRAALESVSDLEDVDGRDIVIENEFVDNVYSDTRTRGLQFTPLISVENDMHGSLHDNNNAKSDEGNVRRQNGVADFTGALQDNNNARSEEGNVLRQNGIISVPPFGGDGNDRDRKEKGRLLRALASSDLPQPKTTRGASVDGAGGAEMNGRDGPARRLPEVMERKSHKNRKLHKEDDSNNGEEGSPEMKRKGHNGIHENSHNNNSENKGRPEDAPAKRKGTITIRNHFVGNNIEKLNQAGVIVTPEISVMNNMSDALHHNNNAESRAGDVARQNGVADFTGSLSHNNNAESAAGNVARQNGIVGEDALEAGITAEAITGLFDIIENTENLPQNILDTIDGAVTAAVGEVATAVGENVATVAAGNDSDGGGDRELNRRHPRRLGNAQNVEIPPCGEGGKNALGSFVLSFFDSVAALVAHNN